MRKLLIAVFALGTMIFTVPLAQARDNSAKSPNAEAIQQRRIQTRRGNQDRRYDRRGNRRIYPRNNRRYDRRYNRRNQRRARTYYQTRNVRRGRQVYRETYRIRLLPNGRRQVKLVRRTRIGRSNNRIYRRY